MRKTCNKTFSFHHFCTNIQKFALIDHQLSWCFWNKEVRSFQCRKPHLYIFLWCFIMNEHLNFQIQWEYVGFFFKMLFLSCSPNSWIEIRQCSMKKSSRNLMTKISATEVDIGNLSWSGGGKGAGFRKNAVYLLGPNSWTWMGQRSMKKSPRNLMTIISAIEIDVENLVKGRSGRRAKFRKIWKIP